MYFLTMTQSREKTFQQALRLCQSLLDYKNQFSEVPCQAINLFCEVSRDPCLLLQLSKKYPKEIIDANEAVEQYSRSIDNWKGKDCPFGLKDHCNILHFFLSFNSGNFVFYRGKDFTPEMICEFLWDWKGIDLKDLMAERRQVFEASNQDAGEYV